MIHIYLADSLYVSLQTVVVDARAHMLGRLASIVAKQLLNGQHVVSMTFRPYARYSEESHGHFGSRRVHWYRS